MHASLSRGAFFLKLAVEYVEEDDQLLSGDHMVVLALADTGLLFLLKFLISYRVFSLASAQG